jgi:hypothetical protein
VLVCTWFDLVFVHARLFVTGDMLSLRAPLGSLPVGVYGGNTASMTYTYKFWDSLSLEYSASEKLIVSIVGGMGTYFEANIDLYDSTGTSLRSLFSGVCTSSNCICTNAADIVIESRQNHP